MSADKILRENGINLPDTSPGRYYTTCPRCSASRSLANQKKEVLGVTIDDSGVFWGCNHCDWTDGTLIKKNGKANGEPRSTIIATYDYVDETGNLLFQVCRKSDKTFPQRRPDGNGGWEWTTTGVRKVVYRMPEVIEAMAHARTIMFAEGEKDCNNLWTIGLPATCNPGGASEPGKNPKWRSDYGTARSYVVPMS